MRDHAHPDRDAPAGGTVSSQKTRRAPLWLRVAARLNRGNAPVRRAFHLLGFQPGRYVRGKGYEDDIRLAGFPFRVLIEDFIDHSIWWYGSYEQIQSRLFLSLLGPGDCVIDVGANVGYYSVLAASVVGKGGRVFAFEPVSSTFSRLRENVQGIESVTEVRAACGDRDGSVDIFVADDTGSGNSRILKPMANYAGNHECVPLVRIDSFLQEWNISSVQMLKIDVEGYEMRVLRGLSKTIETNPEIKILMEVKEKFARMGGHEPEQIFEYIKDHGLSAWRFGLEPRGGWVFERHDSYWGDESLVLFARNQPEIATDPRSVRRSHRRKA